MSEEPAAAVFVDPSGRRGKVVGRAFWLLSCLASAYVVLVLVSLVVPAGLSRLTVPGLGPVVPGAGAPKLRDSQGTKQTVSQLLSPSSRPTSGTERTPGPSPATSPSAVDRATPTLTASPGTATPSPVPRGSSSATPATPSPPSHPTPKSTKAASPKPHPTPTPRR